ncbi:chromatin assembly factor 1 subunit FAS1 [Phalaenopsis equestris]|uniref:chromatin assembly factor 1 subunit FAS1 n=1 Tax=Phalaenopsis equestris TaxID=78828 RepID=UPI0009E2B807|nr:chromatin assembly factor 1 subunit FAS1 [Phalaenopsis equestris]XP_020593516.1 chromatin assembly factor 1 subunit FAS1 [Phalaenopsis equestris]XP_020593517.1 chromatin assembly factor 1 subunit FAS1 [Phalaenopsis equestris]XP_020593518.1 chromatin assembly factor 1 subunit FAS1 [Phalaenopsis equestris]
MFQMADQSVGNDAEGGAEMPQLGGNMDSFPAGEPTTLNLDAKGTLNQKTQRKRKKACMESGVIHEKNLAFIKECQHELDGLFEFYKEVSSCKLQLDEGHFTSLNSAVACMLEESSLSFSALVEEIYGKMKAKEGNQGATLASIRSAVLFVGQRVMYGVVNEDVDVLEDVSEKCLWCWETREMKLLPRNQLGFFRDRRLCRKKIHDRISALSITISSLSVHSDESHLGDLSKEAARRLRKAMNLSNICSLVEKQKQKCTAEMAEKEAQLKEKELIKELERNEHVTEMERKRLDQDIQKQQQQAEKELRRLQNEAAAEEKRLEKERDELKKQLKKQEMQTKKDQQRHEKEAAELKKKLKIQKQATIMERFLKRTKVNDSLDLTSSQEVLISEVNCESESMVNSTSSSMDNMLSLHENLAMEELLRMHIVRWHECCRSNRSNRWGVRSKPKINLFQDLKLLGQTSEAGCAKETVVDKQLGECAEASTNNQKCQNILENSPPNCLVKKLLQFDKSNRPAYYGTWSRKSIIGPRNPFRIDPDLDYEVDSDEEWEEEEPGESLSDCEKDKEDEVLDEENMKEGSDDESEDSFLVPDGYLSENEGVQDKQSDSMDEESRSLTCSQMETENEKFSAFFQQQKYLNNLTEQALRKGHPLIITNLRHEKTKSLNADSLDGTARLEQICLQVLCIRVCPGASAIEIPSNNLASKDEEQFSLANNISTPPATTAVFIPDSELPEFVKAIQLSPQSIKKVVESLQIKFSSISKSQIKNKVKEISDYSDHRWQVKKEVLDRLGLPITTNKSSKEKGIAKFFTKRCLPPREVPFKFPDLSPEQKSSKELINVDKDQSTTA